MKEINFDCIIHIINELRNDKKTLYSCLLVNKKWCNIVVPILWKYHPWNIYGSKRKLYNIILSFLPSTTKNILLNIEIKLPSTILTKPPLFNYLSYCEFPEPEDIDGIINMILGRFVNVEDDKYFLLEQEVYKLFVNNCKDFKNLTWKTCQPLTSFPGASTCFSQLHSLSIDPDYANSNSLYEMSKICKGLYILSIYNCSKDHQGLVSLIDAQKNLEKLNIYHNDINRRGNCQELSKALARKGDTIKELHLDLVNNIPSSFLISLKNLKRIEIYNHETFEETREEISELRQYLAISEFPNLEFFNAKGITCFEEFSLLIKKTRGDLLHFLIDIKTGELFIKNTGALIKEISIHCPNIKILYTFIESKDFIHVQSLLLNCSKLQELRFYSLNNSSNDDDDDDNVGDELLDILSSINLISLNNILLSEDWGYSIGALERFFESFREKNLLSFNILHHRNFYITDNHKEIIRKYVHEGVIRYSNFM
ncbi:hypothetical protein RclHR1_13580002 [Rhizophagus clarus]|uniref:F-box domain-containing protein n=1 Tax=Rhizophagus clarus TaxID=94130 RepID=A0A2Z6QEU3_9GLOM|nr:hypothetical protein RclHR1_13580002 [Rhizophagus clarus]GET02166.1 hypothetical protein GLOIN_2v1880756 [Rhizophagus clarus]